MSEVKLYISGIGLITSVGRDARSSCASIRAGINRATEYPNFKYLVSLDQDMDAILAHPISGVTEGYQFTGLWLKLAKLCVGELLSQYSYPNHNDKFYWRRTALIIAAPYLNTVRFLREKSSPKDFVINDYIRKVVDHFNLPIEEKHFYFVEKGNAGVVSAIEKVSTLTDSGEIDRAIILNVDSWLNESSLEWLLELNRLKTPEMPAGLMPGEAGACLMVEASHSVAQRSRPPLAKVIAVETKKEENCIINDEIPSGNALGQCIRNVAETVGLNKIGSINVIADLNGEKWRAIEYSQANIMAKNVIHHQSPTIFPAESIGDPGVAMGGVCFCIATQVFEREYNSLDNVLITCSSEYGHVGVACLQRVH